MHANEATVGAKDVEVKPVDATKPAKLDVADIPNLAKQFAQAIPEKKLSCAELQGFVLQYRVRPQEAVERVAAWAQEVIDGKQVVATVRTDLVAKSGGKRRVGFRAGSAGWKTC